MDSYMIVVIKAMICLFMTLCFGVYIYNHGVPFIQIVGFAAWGGLSLSYLRKIY